MRVKRKERRCRDQTECNVDVGDVDGSTASARWTMDDGRWTDECWEMPGENSGAAERGREEREGGKNDG